tara:strand:+ start:1768 stop:2997 length:1230 start_codon:yes stop_codon:yes gene_type:complete
MPIPDGGLITETNEQYYAGTQIFTAAANQTVFTTTFNTDLVFGSSDSNNADYGLNNFKIYISTNNGIPDSYTELAVAFTVNNNKINVLAGVNVGDVIAVQLKILDGGEYGNRDAVGDTVEENYGGYSYVTLNDVVNNFMVGYVGDGKLIQTCKKSDAVFHVKRGMQEFSYDTLKSVKSQELSVPPSLNVVIPQDYVNYVRMSWIDGSGVKRIIYPANNLTINPYENPIQDAVGVPVQDTIGDNVEGSSLTEERWDSSGNQLVGFTNDLYNNFFAYINYEFGYGYGGMYGQRYGLEPQISQTNGWFTINEREGKMSFSSNLANQLIVLEYISDGLAYDLDTRLPKMAEEAMYAHLLYSIISTRAGQSEGVVQRFKRERSAKLRNAKIRLSNIKLDEIVQVMRGKSKWIKS